MRKFFTHPLCLAVIGAGFFLLALIGSAFPDDFFLGQSLRAIALLGLLIGLHLIVVVILWTARTVYYHEIKGVPDKMADDVKAILAVAAHISSAILILAAIIGASP